VEVLFTVDRLEMEPLGQFKIGWYYSPLYPRPHLLLLGMKDPVSQRHHFK
jgi:hypothetical protein